MLRNLSYIRDAVRSRTGNRNRSYRELLDGKAALEPNVGAREPGHVCDDRREQQHPGPDLDKSFGIVSPGGLQVLLNIDDPCTGS